MEAPNPTFFLSRVEKFSYFSLTERLSSGIPGRETVETVRAMDKFLIIIFVVVLVSVEMGM